MSESQFIRRIEFNMTSRMEVELIGSFAARAISPKRDALKGGRIVGAKTSATQAAPALWVTFQFTISCSYDY